MSKKHTYEVTLRDPVTVCCGVPNIKSEGYVTVQGSESWEYHCYNCGKSWNELQEPPCVPDVEKMAELMAEGKEQEANSLFQSLCKKHKLKDYEAVMLQSKVMDQLNEVRG
jgi:hypothetical protein